MKKERLRKVYFYVFCIVVAILLGMLFQYIKVLLNDRDYHWTDSLAIQIGGVITGLAAFFFFFIIDILFTSKLKNKTVKNISRFILLSLLVLLFMIESIQDFLK